MKRHTSLTEDELHLYLKKIRRIAKMNDEDAIDEVDEFIKMLSMLNVGDRWTDEDEKNELYMAELEDAKAEIDAISNDIKRYQRELTKKKPRIDYNSIAHLRELLDELGEEWSEKIKNELSRDVETLKRFGYETADKIEREYYYNELNNLAEGKVKYGRKSEIFAINEVVEFYQSNDLMDKE